MLRFGESLYPLDQLLQGIRRAAGECDRIDVERLSQRQQSLRHTATGCSELTRDDLGSIAFDHLAPAVSFLVPQPVDFLGVEGRQSAGDPLPSQIIFIRIT